MTSTDDLGPTAASTGNRCFPALPFELVRAIAEPLSTRDALALAATCHLYYSGLVDSVYARHIRHELHGDKALWWACRQGPAGKTAALAVARRALENGADPGAPVFVPPDSDHVHTTPLLLAVRHKQPALVELLLQYGADPNSKGPVYSPLSLAIDLDCLDVLQLLLSFSSPD
ncbi:hypothetical protein Micbo1qcDRAFT_167689, partial [Microdochium bolleyi]